MTRLVNGRRTRGVTVAAAAGLLLGAGLLAAAPRSAQADVFNYQGNLTPVSASLDIVSLTNGQLVFSFTNTTVGITSALTGIGFDLPAAGGFSLALPNPNNTNFQFDTSPGNVPQFNSADLDFALLTGNNFSGGNPPSGLANGAGSVVFTVNGDFSGLTQAQVADAGYVRFQAISVAPGSDVARRITTDPVPEPGAVAFGVIAGGGLLGLVARGRRRRPAGGPSMPAAAA